MKSVQHSATAITNGTTNGFKKLARDERGATLMEYLMLAGLVAIAAFLGFQKFGGAVETSIEGQAGAVGAIPAAAP